MESAYREKLRTHSVVPLARTIYLDTETVVSLLYAFRARKQLYVLEGIQSSARDDRFSYLAFDPFLTVTGHAHGVTCEESSGATRTIPGNLFEALAALCEELRAPPDASAKFHAGMIGYLSYECAGAAERIPFPEKRELGLPLARFLVPRSVIVVDNLEHCVTFVRNVFRAEAIAPLDEDALLARESAALDALVDEVLARPPHKAPLLVTESAAPPSYECNQTREQFLAAVERCKEYIRAGDIFQVQVSRRARLPLKTTPLEVYRNLRRVNPSPYMFYLQEPDYQLIGASPELLVAVDDGEVRIRPIAGTRRRHARTQSEAEVIEELLHDPKEQAEHIMLVDLARNDVGRVASPGSVKVEELRTIEKYSHVIHMVSTVVGRLAPGLSAVDALAAGFPAGTVTGAPKIRSMEIISELESVQREFYAGGVVYLDFQGNMKSALTIRSVLVKDGQAYTQAAAGIVADSVPELEYKETENKMQACLQVLANTGVRH